MNIAPQRHFVEQGAARIEVLTRGLTSDNQQLVILIPSLGRGAEDFADLATRLAHAGFRAITPQPRGFGASRGPMENITLHDLAKDMAAIINANGGAPAVIGGHAFGNFVARTTAADFPRLVKGVVLIAATHLWPLPDNIRKSIHDSHITAQPEQQLRALQHAFFAPGHDASVWLGGWNETVMHAERAATDATPKAEWWAAGSAPVLDIIPADDIMTPPHERNRYVDEMGAQRVTTVLIPDAGHALLPEQPEATASALIHYLKAHVQKKMPPDTSSPASARADLTRFLNPRSIAIVGASNDPARIGGQTIKLLTAFGFKGNVYPVNPKYDEIAGLKCYPDVASVPQPCDVVLVALAGAQVPSVIEQCGKAGIPFAIVLSAGFGEVEDGKALQAQLKAAIKASGVRVVGPNCLGVANLSIGYRAGFGGTLQLPTLKSGPVAMITQSGGFGFGVVSSACYYGIGFNYLVSTGNEDDLSMLDWVEHVLEQPEVEIVTVFMEGTTEGRRLVKIGERALELGKPILVWKVGNTSAGRQAVTSHTARLTAGPELFKTVFRHGGFVEVRDIDDLVDVCKAFLGRKLPPSNRVGVITMSGGAGVLLADRCVEAGLSLPKLADDTRNKLRAVMVPYASPDNPVDATAGGYNDNFTAYRKAVGIVLSDPNIDAVIARCPRGNGAMQWSESLIGMLRGVEKTFLINWGTAPDDNADVLAYLEANGVPCILAPGRTAHALAMLHEFAQKRRAWQQRQARTATRACARQALDLPDGGGALGEHRSKSLLRVYGIAAVEERLLAPDAVEKLTGPPLPFPLALKIESPDIPHKTEAGVVCLNINSLDALKQAARDILASAKHYKADARIEGILVQQMASGVEVIAGAVNDPHFGPVVTFGLGGIFTELLKDVTHRFAPFDVETAKEMIFEIKAAPLLTGYRGKPALDVAALADTLSRVSLFIADHADRVAELDINPLFVRAAGLGVVAADALIVLKS